MQDLMAKMYQIRFRLGLGASRPCSELDLGSAAKGRVPLLFSPKWRHFRVGCASGFNDDDEKSCADVIYKMSCPSYTLLGGF